MTTGLDVFDQTLEKTNQLLHNIEIELGWEKHRHQTFQILRAVLHALRDRLSVSDAANFSAQLPLLLRGVFFEGWGPEAVPMKMDASDFIERVRCEIFLDLNIPMLDLIRVVLGQIFYMMDPLEQEKIKKSLPEDFGEFFTDNAMDQS